VNRRDVPPILRDKHYTTGSAFTPESLLREARRQKELPDMPVPGVCILDPDGDIVRYLRASGRACAFRGWACYHSEMFAFEEGGRTFGIVGCAVGAAYAVLVAEQMFASGCRLLISITSSGQITALRAPPYFILIERALRDEGTSYHYLRRPITWVPTSISLPQWTLDSPKSASPSSGAQPGPQTLLFVKPPRLSKLYAITEFWPSRWKPQHYMHLQKPDKKMSCASLM
jgi:hypothetical protein